MLSMIFDRYGIPFYQSGTEDILDMTVITTVLSAIDAAVGGFEQRDVLRYLRSALSPLDVSACDRLENYVILWNITGNRWSAPWDYHPRRLSVEWSQHDRNSLEELNRHRDNAVLPLIRLGKALGSAIKLSQMVDALYVFLDEIQMDRRLRALADEMEKSGELRNVQVLGQLWEILLSALEQLTDTLGETVWDANTFTRLLKLLLTQYDVGTIPAVLDAVTVGPVSAMRCQQPDHLIVLGANEGSFPSYCGSSGILTDQERTALRQIGVPLTGGAMEGLQAEFAEIYGVFCGAEKTVTVFSSGGQPSFIFRRLASLVPAGVDTEPLGIASVNPVEVGAYLLRNRAFENAQQLGVKAEYLELDRLNRHSLGSLQPETVRNLYGQQLKLSASQVDKLADCRLAYFLKYGLRLKERKPAVIDPAEFGTYVHAVLEDTARRIMELGGFHHISLDETLQIANQYSLAYISQHFGQIDSRRISYLLHRNAQELEMVVTELWEELRDSAFEPIAFELAFGTDDGLDAITFEGNLITAKLLGFVDRVDFWKADGQVYYRVVDYKTGKKDFDYCDVFNGLGLQMLLYLFALEESGDAHFGEHLIGAGVQYFPARAPVVSVDGRPDDVAAESAREKLWKRNGLVLADESVLKAMEPADSCKRLPITRKKDGTVSGDIADREQLKMLKAYIYALLGRLIDEVASGCVDANPYTRGGRHNACAFCPYGAICNESADVGRRDYAAMSPQKFWEDIEKEMNSNGRKTDT